jgi:hypothetical protein
VGQAEAQRAWECVLALLLSGVGPAPRPVPAAGRSQEGTCHT